MVGEASGAEPYVVVGAVLAAGVLFVVAGMGANRLLRPSVPTPAKSTTYECGVDPVGGTGWAHTRVRYYLYAYLFLGVLAVGLLHAWRRGVLRWQ